MRPGLGGTRVMVGSAAMLQQLRPAFGTYFLLEPGDSVYQWDGVTWQGPGGSGLPTKDDLIRVIRAQQAQIATRAGGGSVPGQRDPGDPSIDDPTLFTAPPVPTGPAVAGGMDVPTLVAGGGDSRSQSVVGGFYVEPLCYGQDFSLPVASGWGPLWVPQAGTGAVYTLSGGVAKLNWTIAGLLGPPNQDPGNIFDNPNLDPLDPIIMLIGFRVVPVVTGTNYQVDLGWAFGPDFFAGVGLSRFYVELAQDHNAPANSFFLVVGPSATPLNFAKLQPLPPGFYTEGFAYWLKAENVGQRVRVKLWRQDVAEPAAWLLTSPGNPGIAHGAHTALQFSSALSGPSAVSYQQYYNKFQICDG